MDNRACRICGKIFAPTTSRNYYCSKECAKIAKRRWDLRVKEEEHKKKKTMTDNMKVISDMVKDDPRYGLKVAKMEGRIK